MSAAGFRATLSGVADIGSTKPASPVRGSDDTAFRDLMAAEAALRPPPGNSRGLDWYPTRVDMAASADLGFTLGPWQAGRADGSRGGQFLSLWTRDMAGRWRVALDAGISHAVTRIDSPLSPPESAPPTPHPPPTKLVEEDGIAHGMGGFATAGVEDGIGAGLRTYARNEGFVLLTDGEMPMELAAADRYFIERPLAGEWQERENGRSRDHTLAYAGGALLAPDRRFAGVQIWQYDSKVANWGLRILLLASAE